jgi:hypothetical protein
MDVQQGVLLKGNKVLNVKSIKIETQIVENKETSRDIINSRGET